MFISALNMCKFHFWKTKNVEEGVKKQLSTGITKNIVPRKGMFTQNSSSKSKPKLTEEISLTLCVKPRRLQRRLYMPVCAHVFVWRMLCYRNPSELRSLSHAWTGQTVTWGISSKHEWKEDKFFLPTGPSPGGEGKGRAGQFPHRKNGLTGLWA